MLYDLLPSRSGVPCEFVNECGLVDAFHRPSCVSFAPVSEYARSVSASMSQAVILVVEDDYAVESQLRVVVTVL